MTRTCTRCHTCHIDAATYHGCLRDKRAIWTCAVPHLVQDRLERHRVARQVHRWDAREQPSLRETTKRNQSAWSHRHSEICAPSQNAPRHMQGWPRSARSHRLRAGCQHDETRTDNATGRSSGLVDHYKRKTVLVLGSVAQGGRCNIKAGLASLHDVCNDSPDFDCPLANVLRPDSNHLALNAVLVGDLQQATGVVETLG